MPEFTGGVHLPFLFKHQTDAELLAWVRHQKKIGTTRLRVWVHHAMEKQGDWESGPSGWEQTRRALWACQQAGMPVDLMIAAACLPAWWWAKHRARALPVDHLGRSLQIQARPDIRGPSPSFWHAGSYRMTQLLIDRVYALLMPLYGDIIDRVRIGLHRYNEYPFGTKAWNCFEPPALASWTRETGMAEADLRRILKGRSRATEAVQERRTFIRWYYRQNNHRSKILHHLQGKLLPHQTVVTFCSTNSDVWTGPHGPYRDWMERFEQTGYWNWTLQKAVDNESIVVEMQEAKGRIAWAGITVETDPLGYLGDLVHDAHLHDVKIETQVPAYSTGGVVNLPHKVWKIAEKAGADGHTDNRLNLHSSGPRGEAWSASWERMLREAA